jgi:hypothetical protein
MNLRQCPNNSYYWKYTTAYKAPPLVPTWSKHSPDMGQTWPKHCPNMSQTWPQHGRNMDMAQTSPKHDPNMAQTCPEHGQNMVQTWPEHSPNMAQTWSRHGPNMAQAGAPVCVCLRACLSSHAFPHVLPRASARDHSPARARALAREGTPAAGLTFVHWWPVFTKLHRLD